MMEGVMNPTEESTWWADDTDSWPTYDPYNDDDLEEYNTCGPSSNFENVLFPVVYSLVFVVGILGNGLLLGVLIKRRKVWSTTDTFILHRVVSDILLLVTLPFWVVEFASDAGWVFGTFLCKLSESVFRMNLYCGSLLLVCISVSYLLSIIPSTKEFMKKKPWVVHVCCVVVWIISILLSVPDWIFCTVKAHEKSICIHNMDFRIYTFLLGLFYTFRFVVPLIALVFCFFCIVWQLRCGTKGLQNQRAFIVVVVVVAVLFLCWTPYNITVWVYNSVHQCKTSLNIALLVNSALRHFHCCLNPILLLIVDVKYRQQQHVHQNIELRAQFS